MPRQLPWLKKGGGNGPKARKTLKPISKQLITSDIDDDFFDGTVLANRKGKGKAAESDDDLLDNLKAASPPPTLSGYRDTSRKSRAPSSSPPPMADLEQIPVEFMQKGMSKFDLRDDEWMMVEDEFLETAKLFTRHLHIAEYERLKERIEEKKKEVEVARPVVTNAKFSAEGAMKEKAIVQEKKQRKAIRDVFASQMHPAAEDKALSMGPPPIKAPTVLSSSKRAVSTVSNPPSNAYAARDSDSDDLDAPRRLAKPLATPKTPITKTPAPTRKPAAIRKSASPERLTPRDPISSLGKPATPLSAAKPRSRLSRATPFDMLDDYAPYSSQITPRPTSDQQTSLAQHTPANLPSKALSPPAKRKIASSKPENGKVGRSADGFDDWGVGNISKKDNVNRREMQQTDQEKEGREREKKKKTAVKLDDIPTFLF